MTRKPMDPFARKMWQGSFVYGGIMLVMFAVLTGFYLHTRHAALIAWWLNQPTRINNGPPQ